MTMRAHITRRALSRCACMRDRLFLYAREPVKYYYLPSLSCGGASSRRARGSGRARSSRGRASPTRALLLRLVFPKLAPVGENFKVRALFCSAWFFPSFLLCSARRDRELSVRSSPPGKNSSSREGISLPGKEFFQGVRRCQAMSGDVRRCQAMSSRWS